MAFFLSRTNIGSRLHSHFQGTQNDALSLSRRQFHIEPGPREQALLAEDPSLRKYKSHKKTVRRLKRVGDVLTIVVVAGCCYEIYVKTLLREEAWKAKAAGEGAS
ncbi:succinate dehydrogenase subunit 7B, mitochondrial [Morus notabilis]|uniref:succinate dehydrogenase subunit 7B, mitochondrial n=1 Tax=Morus notabilis TaxID=981085 RepID=UPI000CED3B47|nr:succinate dehydrogenase subunit 7B, mitochondrial [Morus notabilis]